MRRLLTGYAVRFNKRHHRHGHLFQNRYKSILCEENAYLTQLVAYIHLNPFRGGIVRDVSALRSYPYCCHSAFLGKKIRPWQGHAIYFGAIWEKRFRGKEESASACCLKWSSKGRCAEMTGGGLIRSAGGWRQVREVYRDGIRISSDERILGSSEFVKKTFKRAGEAYDQKMQLRSAGVDLSTVIEAVCGDLEVEEKELTGASKRLKAAQARALVSHIAVRGLSISGSEVARRLKVDRSAVSRAARRVENDADLAAVASRISKPLEQVVNIETKFPRPTYGLYGPGLGFSDVDWDYQLIESAINPIKLEKTPFGKCFCYLLILNMAQIFWTSYYFYNNSFNVKDFKKS